MSDLIIHFLSPMVFLFLLVIAFTYEDYILGLFSGLGFLSLSVAIFIDNIALLSSLENLLLASIYFGVGAYLFIVGTWQEINNRMGG